ncbi:MAG TPA: hypothetical protein VFZ49_05655 [Pyrinomonadaceae bacterium]
MSEPNKPSNAEQQEPEIVVNRHDGAVAVEEADRTVLLTANDTIIVEKEVEYDIAPSNRPRKVYGGMWGPAEIGVVGAASLAVVAALVAYFFFTLPEKRELERNLATRDRLEVELTSARAKYGDINNIQTHVAKLVSSVDDFEAVYLPVTSNGRTALYQKLNGLIASHGLINTSGPDYSPLEISDEGGNNQSDEERGRSRFRSLFPGTYVTMTLEGGYANLRRFIRDIETGNDFVIISAIELEPSDNQNTRTTTGEQADPGQEDSLNVQGFPQQFPQPLPQQQTRRQTGRTLGQVVSLRMEMAAYFKRPVMESQPTAATEGQ